MHKKQVNGVVWACTIIFITESVISKLKQNIT